MTAGFAASYACLCAAQGAAVALPRRSRLLEPLTHLASGWWAIVPLASIVLVVVAIQAASAVAGGLTYLALVTTPPLAAAALIAIAPRGRVLAVAVVLALFALAWGDRSGLAGEAATVALTALACATLGALLATVTPLRWLKLGVIAMAVADTVLVVVDLLQRPNARLNSAAPALGLPQFQRAMFGDAVMGYGDLFLAAVLGGILAREWRAQRLPALVTAGLALAFGTLFFFVSELPATVPVALALVIAEALRRRAAATASADPA